MFITSQQIKDYGHLSVSELFDLIDELKENIEDFKDTISQLSEELKNRE